MARIAIDCRGCPQFTEPNIAFSLAARSEDSVTIRAHLSLGPPSEDGELFDYFVPLELSSKALMDAIDDWETALRAFLVASSLWHNRTVIGTVVPWLPR